MVAICGYERVSSLDELFSLFEGADLPVKVLAGGTDLLTKASPHAAEGVLVADISEVDALIGVEEDESALVVRAATKLADLEDSPLLRGAWGLLKRGASRVGSRQIRNLGTVGGNLCNASPCADTAPALLALDAEVELTSADGVRVIPLTEFFVGPGQTALKYGEIMTAVWIPRVKGSAGFQFLKHSPRRAMDLSVASVAVLVRNGQRGLRCCLAMGSVAPTPIRATQAEAFLTTAPSLDRETITRAADLAAEACVPICDVRGSATYRRELVRSLTQRALHEAADAMENG